MYKDRTKTPESPVTLTKNEAKQLLTKATVETTYGHYAYVLAKDFQSIIWNETRQKEFEGFQQVRTDGRTVEYVFHLAELEKIASGVTDVALTLTRPPNNQTVEQAATVKSKKIVYADRVPINTVTEAANTRPITITPKHAQKILEIGAHHRSEGKEYCDIGMWHLFKDVLNLDEAQRREFIDNPRRYGATEMKSPGNPTYRFELAFLKNKAKEQDMPGFK